MNVYAPERIWATVNGMSTRLPDGGSQYIGGWSEDPTRPGVTEYVRADLPNPLSAENARLREALEEVVRCYDAAVTEGFQEELFNLDSRDVGSMHDLLVRRILVGIDIACSAIET